MIKSRKTRAGDWVVAFIFLLLILVCLLPMLNILARSLSSAKAMYRNEVSLWPVGFNLDSYKLVLTDAKYTWSMAWTAILTVISTIVSLIMTTICAYPFVYDHLKGRKTLNTIIIFTMYFSAGTIPNYLLLNDMKLISNPLVLIIPNCLSVFNMIIMRSFFYGIPDSLRESAELDGAGPIRVLVNIYIPLSTAVIATLALFYAVGRWNGFSDALVFMRNRHYYPLQLHLYNIINGTAAIDTSIINDPPPGITETIKAATIMFATIPILLIYPWLQRFFITGVTIGAVKG